jgi:hypothetical protein
MAPSAGCRERERRAEGGRGAVDNAGRGLQGRKRLRRRVVVARAEWGRWRWWRSGVDGDGGMGRVLVVDGDGVG